MTSSSWSRAVFLSLAILTWAAAFPNLKQENHELLLVKTTTPEQVQLLATFVDDVELDFWTHPMLNSWTTVLLPWRRHQEVTEAWTAAGMEVKVKENNVLDLIDRVREENERLRELSAADDQEDGPLLFQHDEYLNTAMITNKLLVLKNTYPNLVFFDETAQTPHRPLSESDNKPIHVIELSSNVKAQKQVIMLEVNIHAREHITAAANLFFMDWVLANYETNVDARFLLDNYRLVILPVANPDGYDYSLLDSSTRLWRKNRGKTSDSSCTGTDLNRNFNVQWEGGSTNPCSSIYRGQAAEDQAETQAVKAVFRHYKSKMAVYMPVHAYSQLLLLPYSYSSQANKPNSKPPNAKQHTCAAKAMSEAMFQATQRHYTYGLAVETINYHATGSSSDWALSITNDPILAIAYELRPDRNEVSGNAGFIQPVSEIRPAGREYAASIVAVARYVSDGQPDTC